MDKSWITKPRNSTEYEQGVKGFIDFAFEHRSVNGKTICPCKRCGFKKWQSGDVMYDHLICTPFPEGYTFWLYHGELRIGEIGNVSTSNAPNVVQDNTVVEDPIWNMINDAFGVDRHHGNEVPVASNVEIGTDGVTPNVTQEGHGNEEFYELVRDGDLFATAIQHRLQSHTKCFTNSIVLVLILIGLRLTM